MMKIDAQKQNKKFMASFLWIIAIILSVISTYFYNEATSARQNFERRAQFYNEKEKSTNQDPRLTEAFLDFYKRKQAFKALKDKDFTRVFDRIKRQLHLQDVKLKTADDQKISATSLIYKRPVTVTVKVDNEDRFYQLIDRLYNQIPGVVMIEQFSIKPTSDKRFEGQIECLWIRKK